MKARILIVGGGVMGTSIALNAARRTDPLTEPVVLIERRELGAGCSGRSGAILRQFYASREVAGMARDSLRAYSTFTARTGRAIGFHRSGVLTLGGPPGSAAASGVEANVAMMQSIGIEARLVDAGEMRRLVPGIRVRDDERGAWEPESGFVDPMRVVEQFAALARTYGAVTRPGVEATRLVVEGGRVTAVETSEDPIEAEQVVVVAGPWSARLLAAAGVELPLRVVRPEQVFLQGPEGPEPLRSGEPARPRAEPDPLERLGVDATGQLLEDDAPVPHPVILDLEHGYYARFDPTRGQTRLGRTDHEHDDVLDDPDALDERVGTEMRAFSREALPRRLPVYADLPDVDAQAAWYTLTPDSQALIGPLPGVENLLVVTGFSGHGFKLAPSVGEGVTQMLFGDPVSAFDPDFFAPGRFAGGVAEWGGDFGL